MTVTQIFLVFIGVIFFVAFAQVIITQLGRKPHYDPQLSPDYDDDWPYSLQMADGSICRARPIDEEALAAAIVANDIEVLRKRGYFLPSDTEFEVTSFKDGIGSNEQGPATLQFLSSTPGFYLDSAEFKERRHEHYNAPIEFDPETVITFDNISEVSELSKTYDQFFLGKYVTHQPIGTPVHECIPIPCELGIPMCDDLVDEDFTPEYTLRKICVSMSWTGARQWMACSLSDPADAFHEGYVIIPDMCKIEWRAEFVRLTQNNPPTAWLRFTFSGYDGCWILMAERK